MTYCKGVYSVYKVIFSLVRLFGVFMRGVLEKVLEPKTARSVKYQNEETTAWLMQLTLTWVTRVCIPCERRVSFYSPLPLDFVNLWFSSS